MSETIGFVVLERNQASGQLSIPNFADIHATREDATVDKLYGEGVTRTAGRKETYVIATLEVAEDDRD